MACIKINQIQIDQHYICISIYIQGREFLTDILTKSKKKSHRKSIRKSIRKSVIVLQTSAVSFCNLNFTGIF